MKKNGWGLSTMILFCAIIGICLIFSVAMYKSHVEKEIENKDTDTSIVNKTYLGLEEDVALLSKEYFKSNEKKNIVSINKLIDLGYINVIYDLKNSSIKCSGYVEKTKVNNKYNYQTYLKCGSNYETAGYIKNLDN